MNEIKALFPKKLTQLAISLPVRGADNETSKENVVAGDPNGLNLFLVSFLKRGCCVNFITLTLEELQEGDVKSCKVNIDGSDEQNFTHLLSQRLHSYLL